jgi:hypothetical protein
MSTCTPVPGRSEANSVATPVTVACSQSLGLVPEPGLYGYLAQGLRRPIHGTIVARNRL